MMMPVAEEAGLGMRASYPAGNSRLVSEPVADDDEEIVVAGVGSDRPLPNQNGRRWPIDI